jgi:hypothetical protein
MATGQLDQSGILQAFASRSFCESRLLCVDDHPIDHAEWVKG